jgi:hypothetical protein
VCVCVCVCVCVSVCLRLIYLGLGHVLDLQVALGDVELVLEPVSRVKRDPM